jgi:TrmH family RNA methyltransferase
VEVPVGPVLSSPKNPKVAGAARLKKRAFRDREARFLVEGAQCVGEAIREGALQVLFSVEEVDPLVARARNEGVETHVVSGDVMAHLTSTVTPQGLVGISAFLDVPLDEVPAGGCLAILHEVRDPGNAGTVVRSADAAGASGVVFTDSSVDPYNPKAVRASAGSLYHLPIVRGPSTADVMGSLSARGVQVLAMHAAGAEDLYRADLSGPVAFVFGNEARGLPSEIIELADSSVRVPHAGRAESLNLAAAATVCLFEWARRRRIRGEGLEAIIAAAAHDIRSPLTAMKGFGFALEQRWDAMADEQRALMLRGIVYDADRMDTILRQLVDAARVVEGRLETFPEQTDIGELTSQIAEAVARDPEHPPVTWSGGDLVAFVDPARLRTTLLAFTEAAAWWAQDGPVEIAGALEDGRLHVRVSRATTELSSEGAGNLFLARRPGAAGGSKIGMFVARAVAEAQGGRAWAEVLEGRLIMHVELPTS